MMCSNGLQLDERQTSQDKLILDYCFALDLTSISISARKKLAWSPAKIARVERLYRQYLFLCYKYKTVVPSGEIDAYWELHILDTKQYFNDCMTIFGCFLHHTPNILMKDSGISQQILMERFDLTKTYYSREFGLGMEDAVMSECDDCIPDYDPPNDPEPAPDGIRMQVN